MATLGTLLYSWINGKLIGKDEYGNKYYEHKSQEYNGRKRRWVIYNGIAEPTKVPPKWHGWLHYMTDILSSEKFAWQKNHVPNLTGTDYAYRPTGHLLKGGKRDTTTGDYQAWRP